LGGSLRGFPKPEGWTLHKCTPWPPVGRDSNWHGIITDAEMWWLLHIPALQGLMDEHKAAARCTSHLDVIRLVGKVKEQLDLTVQCIRVRPMKMALCSRRCQPFLLFGSLHVPAMVQLHAGKYNRRLHAAECSGGAAPRSPDVGRKRKIRGH
jgi:hypothetical protein